MKINRLPLLLPWLICCTPAFAALSVTFTNPTPATGDRFGTSVAAVGVDRLLIGAHLDDTGAGDAGVVYLFSTNGALLTTFTNPTPAAGDYFGASVAALGSDRVLVGAYGKDAGAFDSPGAAYLFTTNAALLTTFTNPTPATLDFFGIIVVAVGSDRVLISAYMDDTGATDAGAAYLFSTNGTLVTTFTNPTPVPQDNFGVSVAALGSGRVLIGAYRDDTGAGDTGAAYLFSTNGMLLTTFTNPAPGEFDYFGISVAALGTDRVLIAAHGDDTGAGRAGAAYLFTTNGTLLTTFTNPTPADLDYFGGRVTAVGGDKVLISATTDDTGAPDAGVAYLFRTNGTLLVTFLNPTPEAMDVFGSAITVLGGNRPLIGAHGDNTGAPHAGAAYLFDAYDGLPSVTTLSVTSVGSNIALLQGSVNPNGSAATAAWFEWGTTTNYGAITALTNVGSGAAPMTVALLASDLVADTLYHFRIVASNLFGLVNGSDGTFPFPFPMALTESPTDVTATSATLRGTVYPDGWPVTAWFRWRDANGNGSDATNSPSLYISARTNSVPLSQPLTGLLPGHTYSFELWVTEGSFIDYHSGTFTTRTPATVITYSASSVTPSNATLAGSVNPSALPTMTWFEWGTTTNYGNVTSAVDAGSGSTNVPVNMSLTQLSGLLDYNYRLVVSNAAGVFYGANTVVSTPSGRTIDGYYVTPTLIPANTPHGYPAQVTATALGNNHFPTTGDWRVRLTRNGNALTNQMHLVSVKSTKAIFDFPSMNAGLYGFLIQYSNEVTHAWEDIYESGPRFFQVGEDVTAFTYNPLPRGNWTEPTQPKNFVGTQPTLIGGMITGTVTVAQQVHPTPPPWPPWEHMAEWGNSGFLHLGWTKDFRLDGEGPAGVKLDFNFPLDGTVTFNYAIPFQLVLDFPTNVYAGQNIQPKVRDFRFNGGTLSAQHQLSFRTRHGLWLNAPYDFGFPPVDNEHSFEPDRLVVWGELPVAPTKSISYGPWDSREFPWNEMPWADLFDDGRVTVAEIAGLPDFAGLPDYLKSRMSYANITLGGQTTYNTSGGTNRFWYGPHEIWTGGPADGWQETPQLWYANVDMIGLSYVSSIPYYSQAAAPLFFAGVELGLNCGVNVRSRDVINLKPPATHDLTVHIPSGVSGAYAVVTNLSLPIDATLVSYYLYKLWGGLYFDMPGIDRKDLGWSDDDFWRPEVRANISVNATFSLNKAVWVTNRTQWITEYVPAGFSLAADTDYDLINYPPAEADEERRWLANLSFDGPPPPPMVPQVILGTFPDKPTSMVELMLGANPAAGTTNLTVAPPPVAGGYSNGTVVTITAHAARGHRFTGWSGDITSTDNPATITMNANKSVMANFTTARLGGAGYLTNGNFGFYVGGVTGLTWVVQWTTNLSAPYWLPIMTNTTPFTFTETNVNRSRQGYFRVVLP